VRARPRRLSVAVSAADGDGEDGMMGDDAGDDTSSAVATKPKRKVNAELDDLVGEMAGRANDEPVIIPRGAGIAPMAPGPIKADPIPGMDGESVTPAVLFGFAARLMDRSNDQPVRLAWKSQLTRGVSFLSWIAIDGCVVLAAAG